jgi:Calx-beta domain
MKRPLLSLIAITCLLLVVLSGVWGTRGTRVASAPSANSLNPELPANTIAIQDLVIVQARPDENGSDPDRPPGVSGEIDHEAYLRLRDEYVAMRRGVEIGRPFDFKARGRAIQQMERQEKRSRLESLVSGSLLPGEFIQPAWTELGPKPLPNAQGLAGAATVTGRATSIVIDPTNPNRVYLGTAQGGVWRSLDAGLTWTNIFDAAQSLAIGAIAVAPSDPSKVYVGTGEANQSGDSFFGVGMYRIDNAFTTADLVGPINPIVNSPIAGQTAFTGRGITKILVHPASADIVFATTAGAVGGIGGNTLGTVPPIAIRGLYRSTNATAAASSVGFTKLTVTTAGSVSPDATGNRAMFDMVFDPANPSIMLVAVQGQSVDGQPTTPDGSGGVWRTVNALDAAPTFTRTLALGLLASGGFIRSALAINGATVYAATGEASTITACSSAGSLGLVRKSTDGGITWSTPLPTGQGFCGGQCGYNIAIAVNPANANNVYIGGQARSPTCSDSVKRSQDGGATFVRDDNNLHADTHGIVFDGQTVYTVNDGGVWKRQDAAPNTPWTNLNTAPLGTLQFMSLAVHPLDQNLTIGGTQDNGTELQTTVSGSWTHIRGGDGGYTLIDQNATDTTNVTMYHTFFFSSGTQIRYERASTPGGSWLNIGCTNGTPANGINCGDRTLFYAPMALGPGAPNPVYLGTDRLYRSGDAGISHTIVSQEPIVPTGCGNGAQSCRISSIAISPQDDNVRVLGFENGQVMATSVGSSALVNVSNPSPFPANPNGSTNKFVGRAMIDPNNPNVAYIALSYYAPAGQGVWKITNLAAAAGPSQAASIWVAAGNGIPSIPVNAFAVDPLNSNNLFAGTDIGVYNSTDGGANWLPYGTGLPRSAVFDMKIQPTSRLLRIATHGRGMWDIPITTGAPVPPTVQFDQPSYTINEGLAFATINVTRNGDASAPATVKYATSDATDVNFLCNPSTGGQPTGAASRKCDYHIAVGRLRFAAGENTKPIIISIVNDVYVEPSESLTITLSSPTGATLGTPSTATLAITDNDTPGQPNPIDGTAFYVRMLYVDLLSREPDPGGLAGWIHRIDFCGQPGEPPPPCDRVTVGGDGFLRSTEFFDREFFVIRLYRSGLGRILTYNDVGDLAYVSGFLSDADLELNKQELVSEIMSRSEFGGIYNGLNNSQYVDTLIQTAAVTLDPGVRNGWVSALDTSTKTRAQVYRELSERPEVSARYLHEAQVVSCYYGFFTRNPDGAYFNFLERLDRGEINLGDLANAFINASEYRQRFGP